MTRNDPGQMIPPDRRPVISFFDPDPPVCTRCGHRDTPGDPVDAAGSDQFGPYEARCTQVDRCHRRQGLPRETFALTERWAKPTTRTVCTCCGGRIPDGIQELRIVGGKVFHASHKQCEMRCGLGMVA